jgi:chain length determinant protein tyrosine kinase EpsG
MGSEAMKPATVREVDPGDGKSRIALADRDRSIGAILVDHGRLTPAAAEQILRAQRERGLRFGEAAIHLGILTERDIQFALAQQFDYPYLHAADTSVAPELIAAFDPFAREVETLRAVRTQLVLRWFGVGARNRHALAVVGAQRGDGRSYVAANLAIVFSQLGERTLLIDADLRNPRQHELFKLDNRSGLSALLAGRTDLTAIQIVSSFVDLSVLTAGTTPPNPQELLGRGAFAQAIDSLSARYDVILIDTPAIAVGADAASIAAFAGGALVVARRGVTPVKAIGRLADDLRSAGAAVVGSVLNDY